MPQYRLYPLNADGRVCGPPRDIECSHESDAMAHGCHLHEGRDFEVWEGERRLFGVTQIIKVS